MHVCVYVCVCVCVCVCVHVRVCGIGAVSPPTFYISGRSFKDSS